MDIVKRLLAKRQVLPMQGGASLGTDSLGNHVSTSYIIDDGMRLVNPDGPEAADTIEALCDALRECNSILGDLTGGTPDPSGADIIVHYERCVKAELSSRKELAKAGVQ